jgi:16S rRNA (cytosine1402-N4)-methyltransferase
MTHVAVLLEPAVEYLAIRPDGVYVDATFGAGGHSRAILSRLTSGRLIALDADPAAAEFASAISDPHFSLVHANFRDLNDVLDGCGVAAVDGVLFDFGVSSMQLDDPERGFSIGKPAALDMRMNPHVGRSAYDILATASERELADIFFYYGEERAARRIARAIVHRRAGGALPNTTSEFARLVAGVVQRPGRRERIHPATRVFQALRIAVNDELDTVSAALRAAIGRLRAAGRVVAISFHSLEDRIVKQSFRDDSRLLVLTKRPVVPDEREVDANPRARSAKLRAAERKVS